MKEDFLHYIWKNKKVPLRVTLSNGEVLDIVSFGTYNTYSGPDFFDARLMIDGQLWAGNVEMHVRSSHWYAHKHETDSAYSNVILHVVWEHDVDVFSHQQQSIPTLELKNIIEKNLIEDYKNLVFSHNKFISCEKYYTQTDEMVAVAWRERLFVERLQDKSKWVGELLAESQSDWEKVLFLMLLKHLGGTVNGEAFVLAGKRLDFAIVRKEATYPERLEALFFGMCGLLDAETDDPYQRELYEQYRYLRHKYSLSEPVLCRFSGLRPQGFPTIRLSQLAMLYHRSPSLFSKLIDQPNWENCQKILSISTSDYWNEHYTFSKISKKSSKKWTFSYIQLIWINVVAPLLYLYQKNKGNDYSELLSENMRLLSAESNSIISNFENIGVKIDSAYDSQVMLQQYKKYCTERRCIQCSVGVHLLNFEKLKNKYE